MTVDVRRFLTQHVQVERRVSTDAFRGHSYAPPEVVRARWFTEVSVLAGDQDRQLLSSAHVTLLEPVSEGDRITDEAGRSREVVRVRTNRDTRGNFSHYVAYLA